uniref:Ion transport domain-containing protein n=1 Tax=Globisporangium ultimum (strain ATCC 200006 / CBS 805.95 / DAOM BR144) TaxID=431595 RepID=K3WA03_GLOUD
MSKSSRKVNAEAAKKLQPDEELASSHACEHHINGKNRWRNLLGSVHKHDYIRQIQTVCISLFFLIRNPRVVYFLWQILIAILGSYVNKLYFAFHLLDVVNQYQELSNVLRSIVRPAKVLGLTVLLYLVIVYVFAIIGFYFFRADYNPSVVLTPDQIDGKAPYQCQRLFQCFLMSLDQGFKSDGGLGGYLRPNIPGESARSYARLAFDLMYNIVLIIMLLNIVFGVIIDTFASLRTADKEKMMDMQNRCFICSIDAYTFDRTTKRGFHDHIYMEHNMWHYLYLFVHIRKKPITEYNGLELYLAMRMAKHDF